MKNIFFFFTIDALIIFSNANAQRTATQFFPFQNNLSASELRDVTDTIILPSFIPVFEGGIGCFTGIYAAPDSGFVSGNNQYGDLAKAQFYSLSQLGYGKSGAIKNVLINVAYKTISASPGEVSIQIFNCDTNQFQPMDLLGTSNSINISSISSSGSNTLFTFSTPVQVPDSFFISVVLPATTGDTLALLSTVDNCVTNSGWAFEQWNNGTWHQIKNSWILDIDLAIFPVADLPLTGINDQLSENEVSISPNPVNDFCNISFPKNFKQVFSLKILNSSGAIVFDREDFNSDEHISSIDFSNLENGVYTILLHSSSVVLSSKAIVIH